MSTYFINGDTMTGIADATRQLCGTNVKMTPQQIEHNIRKHGINYGVNVTNHIMDGEWVRPQEYPDLDSITIPSDFDGMYLTYDLRKTPGYGWIGLYIQVEAAASSSDGIYYVERGHLSNGEFIVDESHQQARNTYFRQLLDNTYGDVQLWRVWSPGHILRKGFCPSTTSSSTAIINQLQPCVECIGRLNYLNNLVGTAQSTSSIAQCTAWMEHEKILCAGLKSLTQFSNTWRECYSLQSLEIGDWDTSNWVVSSFSNVFRGCRSLLSLDLSKWDVSKWTISTFNSIFRYCYSIESIDISTWDVSNWNISGSFGYNFSECYSLKYLDISNWDVSDWRPTAFEYNFYNCHLLTNLDFSEWDVSDWTITGFSSNFYNCYNLKNLDMSNWDTSKWTLTEINHSWCGCESLKSLDISNWDTSNWAITNFSNVFNNCTSLEEIDLSKWDVSDWEVTNISNAFNLCTSLKELDLSTWDISNWSITDYRYLCTDLYSAVTIKLPTGAFNNISNASVPNNLLLQNFSGEEIYIDHSYSNCIFLTSQSIKNILNKLPTIGSTKTITLGAQNLLKVTSADIAVATQKGWTVA